MADSRRRCLPSDQSLGTIIACHSFALNREEKQHQAEEARQAEEQKKQQEQQQEDQKQAEAGSEQQEQQQQETQVDQTGEAPQQEQEEEEHKGLFAKMGGLLLHGRQGVGEEKEGEEAGEQETVEGALAEAASLEGPAETEQQMGGGPQEQAEPPAGAEEGKEGACLYVEADVNVLHQSRSAFMAAMFKHLPALICPLCLYNPCLSIFCHTGPVSGEEGQQQPASSAQAKEADHISPTDEIQKSGKLEAGEMAVSLRAVFQA